MGRKELPQEIRIRGRITTLVTDETKERYLAYCEKIGSKPCTRLREFIEAELTEDRASGVSQ